MYNQPYFIPRYFASTPSMMRGTMNGAMGRAIGGAMGNSINGIGLATQGASRGLGLFNRLGSSMRAIKGINWGGLITNASKTLNVVNQAIPLVRQVGPMMNNMKSMMRIASIFKDETDIRPKNKNIKGSNSVVYNKTNTKQLNNQDVATKSNATYYDNSPTFFVGS